MIVAAVALIVVAYLMWKKKKGIVVMWPLCTQGPIAVINLAREGATL